MKVTVTQQHIDKGLRKSGYGCPVALAMREATGFEAYVYPGQNILRTGFGSLRTYYQIPRSVRIFVFAFDVTGKGNVGPFTFTLRKAKKA